MPFEVLYDNMKQMRLAPGELNPLFADFARHYGFAVKTPIAPDEPECTSILKIVTASPSV